MKKMKSAKTLLLFVFIMSLSFGLKAQGIEFFHGSFEEAKAKAKQENKPLFIDVFTSWCGPCKMLSKKVFPKKEVGDYFNKSFVCFKLQTDKKGTKNEEIASKYNVIAYPTLMWLDGNGKLMHLAVGYKEPEALIAEAKIVFNEDKRVGTAVEKWNKGDRSYEVASKYFSFDGNSKGEFATYFNSLTKEQKLDSLTFQIVTDVRIDLEGDVFKFLVKHREDYKKVAYSFEISRVIDSPIEREFKKNYGTDQFAATLNKYKMLGFKPSAMFAKQTEWKHFLAESDFVAFEKSALEYINEFGKENPKVHGDLIFDLFQADRTKFSDFKNPKVLLKWADKLKKLPGQEDFCLAELLALVIVGENEKAKRMGNDFIASSKDSKEPGIDRYCDYVKSIIAKIK